MTILLLDQYSDLGGAQRCLLDLLPAARARGWKLHVAAPEGAPLREGAEREGACFHAIRCGPFTSGRKSLADMARFAVQMPLLRREIARLAEACAADLVYVNGPRLLPAVPPGLPVIFHCHSRLMQHSAVRLACAGLRRTAATVIGCCGYVLEPLRPRLDGNRLHVVYNGVASSSVIHKRKPDSAWRIGVIGRIAPEKGQSVFLEAARHLSGCRFVICGAPLFEDARACRYYEHVRELAHGLPVEFAGWQPDVAAVLAELDLVVIPSGAAEATTRVALEAGAAGVPIAAFRAGGIPEVVTDGVTGFLAEPPTPGALAARIRSALDAGPEALAAVARNAHDAWRERFTVERYRSQVLSIVERAGTTVRQWNSPRDRV